MFFKVVCDWVCMFSRALVGRVLPSPDPCVCSNYALLCLLAVAVQNHLTQLPRPHPIRYRQFDTLHDMLKSGPFGQVGAIGKMVFKHGFSSWEGLTCMPSPGIQSTVVMHAFLGPAGVDLVLRSHRSAIA
jgi:hypothetical protein